jgi:asparagine synthase (glutamine-hydrolysing)
MCGIAAIASVAPGTPPDHHILKKMTDAIYRRGPDDEGFYVNRTAGVGIRRLSIIDVSGGRQPICNEDGTLILVCNGEIYNHRDLREELVQKGHRFKSRSDVEVILHLYEELGPACLNKIAGMYAFALWDDTQKTLFAARDRLGIKPLFYTMSDGALYLASEIKAILKVPGMRRELDWQGLEHYFELGYIPAPYTAFSGIKKLLPGHSLMMEKGRLKTARYWDVRFRSNLCMTEQDFEDGFLTVFSDAVKSHLMSDVPLGAFLSGGVDSSLVVALMSQCGGAPVNTFTIGFAGQVGGFLDERRYAKLVSQRYGTNHVEYEVEPRLDEILEGVVDSFDEPFADDSVVPSWCICKLARQTVKVVLTGLGGDELFGGYERYLGLKLSEMYGRLPSWIRKKLIAPAVNALPELKNGHYTINHIKRFVRASDQPQDQRYADYVSVFNGTDRARLLSPEFWQNLGHVRNHSGSPDYFGSAPADSLLDMATYQDFQTYVPEDILALSDRMSMYHSLEVRVPFLDHKVVEFCAAIPASLKIKGMTKKYLLKKVAKPFLPDSILTHRKQGFACPMAAWLRTDLKAYVEEALSESRLSRHGLFNSETVQGLIRDHMERRELNDRRLFTLLMFQKWYEKHVEG